MEGALASDESTQPRPLPLFLSRCQDRSGLTAGPGVGDSAAENPEGLPEFYFILKLVNVRVNSGLSGSLFVPEKTGTGLGAHSSVEECLCLHSMREALALSPSTA